MYFKNILWGVIEKKYVFSQTLHYEQDATQG